MKKLNKKGFTIIELVIVIAVIAILAAVMVPTFSSIVTKANESAAKQEAAALYKAALAIDLADGDQDAKEGTTSITQVEGENVTYTYNDTDKTFSFSYTGSKYTATTTDGTNWSLTPVK